MGRDFVLFGTCVHSRPLLLSMNTRIILLTFVPGIMTNARRALERAGLVERVRTSVVPLVREGPEEVCTVDVRTAFHKSGGDPKDHVTAYAREKDGRILATWHIYRDGPGRALPPPRKG